MVASLATKRLAAQLPTSRKKKKRLGCSWVGGVPAYVWSWVPSIGDPQRLLHICNSNTRQRQRQGQEDLKFEAGLVYIQSAPCLVYAVVLGLSPGVLRTLSAKLHPQLPSLSFFSSWVLWNEERSQTIHTVWPSQVEKGSCAQTSLSRLTNG